MSKLSNLRRVGLALLLLGGVSSAWAGAMVTGINQVSATRVGRTTYNYTYTINVTNGTSALSNAVATVTSNAAGTTIAQGTVALGTLAASASITSTNTFTLQQDRLVPFDPASLIWTVTGTPVDLVPNVVGLTQAAASSAITGAGLVLGTVTQQSSTSVASGNVISESPVAGTQVNQGSAVNLVVSSGAAQATVPNVLGLTQAAASSAITAAGLVLGTVTQQSSTSVASGSVISESPIAGTQVNQGSAVNLVVSSGAAQATVPNVLGLTQAAASSAITAAGLVLGTVTQQSSTSVASGNVISESPVAGTQVNQGSAVNLVVSSGAAQAIVPNVLGLTQAAASSAITAAGLVLGTVTQQSSTSVASGNVISESPVAGTQVNQGSAVNLVVSSGGGIGNQINFQAPPPPDPSSVAAALPTNANGQPILLELQGLQLAIASRPRGPVEGLAMCTRWVAMCVQSAGNPSLDDCAHSAPVCQTSTPWAESQCCPSACFSSYQSERLGGTSPVDAFKKIYLSGLCYPGIN